MTIECTSSNRTKWRSARQNLQRQIIKLEEKMAMLCGFPTDDLFLGIFFLFANRSEWGFILLKGCSNSSMFDFKWILEVKRCSIPDLCWLWKTRYRTYLGILLAFVRGYF